MPKAFAFGLVFAPPNSLMRQDMIWNWMTFALDAARLGRETQEVMALRLLKLARGGRAAEVEAQRMVTEKGAAFAEAAATLATGGSMKKLSAAYAAAWAKTGGACPAPARTFAAVATELLRVSSWH